MECKAEQAFFIANVAHAIANVEENIVRVECLIVREHSNNARLLNDEQPVAAIARVLDVGGSFEVQTWEDGFGPDLSLGGVEGEQRDRSCQ
jgi:hypothetical protein